MGAPELNEPILDDDYPVYCGYLYVADGRVISSDIQGNVRRLKHDVGATDTAAAHTRWIDAILAALRHEWNGGPVKFSSGQEAASPQGGSHAA